jgi:hypothetical protein
MKYLRVELKVCEGCGALWFRLKNTNAVYCSPCSLQLSTFPEPRAMHPGGRPSTGRPRRRPRVPGTCAARSSKAGTR